MHESQVYQKLEQSGFMCIPFATLSNQPRALYTPLARAEQAGVTSNGTPPSPDLDPPLTDVFI